MILSRNKMTLLLITILGLAFQTSYAAEVYVADSPVLRVDHSIPGVDQLRFQNEEDVSAESSDFEILSSILMSSEAGERWATVTLKNESAHQRIFKPEHILATFANGYMARPLHLKQVFEGAQVISLTLNFGVHKFPIVRLSTRN